jgi:hypothetical protein
VELFRAMNGKSGDKISCFRRFRHGHGEGEEVDTVENPILEKVRSGGSGQTFALLTKKKVSKQMEVASAPTYASILKKGLKWAPVTVHSF